MEKVSVDVWAGALEKLKQKIGSQRFELWFKHTELIRISRDVVEVGAPNLFVAEWLQTHFSPLVADILKGDLGAEPAVRFKTSPRLFREACRRQLADSAEIVADASARQAGTDQAPRPRSDMTLVSFVVGPGSRLAHACALEMVSLAHSRYNPLFLHSDCGLGKTHLLNGIWNGIRNHNDGRKAEYLSAEVFTNEFVYAMNNHRLDAFRERYRNTDVLLIDDVNFFNGKNGLQEELLHTFDALHRRRRQIVLASDTHPRKMSSFRRNLVSRFVSGMVVCIEPPDADTRFRILVAKASKLGCRISGEVLTCIAQRVAGSVRDLEGALTGVVAYSRLCNRPPDLEMVREAMQSLRVEANRALSVKAIEKVVAEVFGVSKAALHSPSRARKVSVPRQVCMSLAHRYTQLSCAEIAAHFGKKHHTSVGFAEKRVPERCESDPDFRAKVAEVERLIRPS